MNRFLGLPYNLTVKTLQVLLVYRLVHAPVIVMEWPRESWFDSQAESFFVPVDILKWPELYRLHFLLSKREEKHLI